MTVNSILIWFGLFLCFTLVSNPVYADQSESEGPAVITFQLTGYGDSEILRLSLMKEGESYKDGMARQYQNIVFNRETSTIEWNPCDDNACTFGSTRVSGGNTGRDQLILEVTLQDPFVDISSCYGDPVCERLRGGTTVKSGMLEGFFKTGNQYKIVLDSLKAGFGEAFLVTELS